MNIPEEIRRSKLTILVLILILLFIILIPDIQASPSLVCSKYEINNAVHRFLSPTLLCVNLSEYQDDLNINNITSISWAFGDGKYETSPVTANCSCVTHYYYSWHWEGEGSEGHYAPFTLTVTDDAQKLYASFNLTIFIAGDANGDGEVNIIDAVYVGMHFGERSSRGQRCCEPFWEDTEADAADLNNDGAINILDAVIVGVMWGHTAWWD